jgi:hypothetical protein
MTLDQFLTTYSQFTNISERVEIELVASNKIVPIATDIDLRDKAIGLLTAHVLSVEYRDMLDIGQIIKETEQGSSIRQDIYLDGDDYYEKTIYGLGFKKLLTLLSGKGSRSLMFVV